MSKANWDVPKCIIKNIDDSVLVQIIEYNLSWPFSVRDTYENMVVTING